MAIGVVGASGGVGASTLTAALAIRAHTTIDDCGLSIALDLDVRGGLDTVLCVEHLDGPRWSDLELRGWAEGEPGHGVAASDLPGAAQVHVLAGTGGAVLDWSMVIETIDALAVQCDLVTVDCGPRPHGSVLSRLDLLVVLARTTAKGANDAVALARTCALARTRRVLVTRGAPRDEGGRALARELGISHLAHLADDPVVARHAREGAAPGTLPSAVDGVADEVLTMAESDWLVSLVGRLDSSARSA